MNNEGSCVVSPFGAPKTRVSSACLRSVLGSVSGPGVLRRFKRDLWVRCNTNSVVDMRIPTMWYVRPAKPRISLRIRAI